MKFSKLFHAIGCLGLASMAIDASAAMVTLSGSGFDLTYDDQMLMPGQGAPLISGHSVAFTPHQLKAESRSGAGLQSISSAYSFVISPHDGFRVANLQVLDRGDYVLRGAKSWISLAGLASVSILGTTQTPLLSASLLPDSGLALDLADGTSHNWSTSALLSLQGQSAFSSGADVQFNLDTTFAAYTDVTEQGATRAFVQNKFASETITLAVITVPAVPEPGQWALMLASLGVLAVSLRKR